MHSLIPFPPGTGAAAGAVRRYGGLDEVTEFKPELFWYCVLPPIILQQAYSLRKQDFFTHLMPILMFGVLGTVITFGLLTLCAYYFSRLSWVLNAGCTEGLVGLHGKKQEEGDGAAACFDDFSLVKSLLLAAILSASDGVAALKHIQPHGSHRAPSSSSSSASSSSSRLSALILGENVLNEALSILFFKTAFDDYVTPDKEEIDHFTGLRSLVLLSTAVLIGVLVGLACARLFRRFPSFRGDPLRQVAILIIINYLAFGIAESLELSGTLTLLFCTMTVSHYSYHNLAPEAQTGAFLTFELMATIAEAFSFVYIGLTLAGMSGRYSSRFSFLIFLSVMGARLASVLLLSPVVRLWDRQVALSFKEQLALAVAGMIRGNVSWAQALQLRAYDHEIASTVLVVVLLGMFLFDILVPLSTRLLGLRGGHGHGHGPSGQEEKRPQQQRKKSKKKYPGLLIRDEEGEDGPFGMAGECGPDELLLVYEVARTAEEKAADDEEHRRRVLANETRAARWNRWLFAAFRHVDETYMQPFFSGDGTEEEETAATGGVDEVQHGHDEDDDSSLGSSTAGAALIRQRSPGRGGDAARRQSRQRFVSDGSYDELQGEEEEEEEESEEAEEEEDEYEEEELHDLMGGASFSSLSLPYHHDETASLVSD